MKKLIYLLIILLAGCGTEMTVSTSVNLTEPPPSNIINAGTISGGGYSTGGEHYKAVQILGNSLGSEIQTSENGRYQNK